MQRRQFLQRLGCAASVPALAHAVATAAMTTPADGLARATPRWRSDPFALGVASGEPRPDSVLLWTRLYPGAPRPGQSATDAEQAAYFEEKSGLTADQSCIVSYEVFDDEALKTPIRKGEFVTHAARGWSVHARITGLRPDRPYWYRFSCANAVSPVGRTRTAPIAHANVARLQLALASCQHYEQGHYPAHAEMARQDLDFVLFVGDYIYESTNPAYRLRPHTGGVPKTLAAYRERHALYKSDADLRACHAAHPWICTWDDHEVDNDYAADQDRAYSQPGVFLARRAAAYQAYFEHMPVWPGGPGGAYQRIHQHWQWGQLLDMWTLDCRQFRSAQPCRDALKGGGRVVLACDERDDPARTMLGAEQEAWLAQGMRAANGRWRVLAQSTQISSTGIDTPLGRTIYTDGWDGYVAARSRLLKTAHESGARNVVALGGDVHQNVAANLRERPNDPDSPVVASEFVTTSVTTRGMSTAALDRIKASNPDIAHARSDERGYTLIDISPQQVRATFRTTPFPAQADATLGVQARFAVMHGHAGVEPA
ncbi:MAG: alkaline phosphatase D family protein [Burkholderiales bacterium]|nr:alkaline phosphatase D family protein [Burkholderiales bacterium]